MAKSGFVPAWMKISSNHQLQNETNSTIIKGRQRHHSSEIDDHTTTRHTLFYYSKSSGINCRCRLVIMKNLFELFCSD